MKRRSLPWLVIFVFIVACQADQTNPTTVITSDATSIVAVSPIPTEPDLTLQPSNLNKYLLSDEEISSILDSWLFPGADRTQDLRDTYCGMDCVAMEWLGGPTMMSDGLIIVVIQHQTVDQAKNMMEVFELGMLDDGNAIITLLGNVKGDDVKNAVNPSFTEYDTLVRQKNITIQISLDFKATPPSDAAKRGGTVVTELYAQLQLDKLTEAGYFTDY